MQFLVTGYDGTDEKALERRLAVRDAHLACCEQMLQEGNTLFGVALLDDPGKMIGSALICEFPSRKELDQWLEKEPYVTGKVWQKIDVQPCKVGPSFVGLKPVATPA